MQWLDLNPQLARVRQEPDHQRHIDETVLGDGNTTIGDGPVRPIQSHWPFESIRSSGNGSLARQRWSRHGKHLGFRLTSIQPAFISRLK